MEKSKKLAFSLAELMITLLILSIVLSAVMPAVTKRNTGSESIWRWSDDNSSSTYFGTGNYQTVLIGMAKKPEYNGVAITDYKFPKGEASNGGEYMSLTAEGDRLMLETISIGPHPVSNSHISFFNDNPAGNNPHYTGRLALDQTNIALGKYTLARIEALPTDENNPNSKNNIAIGQNAMHDLTSGHDNLAIGNDALYAVAKNFENIAIGKDALKANQYGGRNTAIGYQSLTKTTGTAETNDNGPYFGNNNTALGYQTLFNNLTGYENIAVGHQALFDNTGGYMNTAIGNYSLKLSVSSDDNKDIPDGYVNTAVGYGSLYSGGKTLGNTAVGTGSGYSTSTGRFNSFIGTFSGFSNTNGVNNTFVGAKSGYNSTVGKNNTYLGAYSGFSANNETASDNTYIGFNTGYSTTTGTKNIYIGSNTGYYNAEGSNNTFVGEESGYRHTGSSNVFIGAGAGYGAQNANGTKNVFIGNNSGFAVSTSDENVFVGHNTGVATTSGGKNTFVGFNAGAANTTGTNNVYIGYNAGANNDSSSSDKLSIANGHSELISGTFNSTPDNTVLNFRAEDINIGINSSDPSLEVTSSLITLGVPVKGKNNQININDTLKMGNKDIQGVGDIQTKSLHASNQVVSPEFVGHLTGNVTGYVTPPSDKRLKNIKGDAEYGLNAVDAFKIVKFNYKNDETKTEHIGVIAQDLEKVLPVAVQKGEDGFLKISLNEILFTVAKAVQELHQAVLGIAKDLKSLTVKVTSNSEKIDALEKENKALKQQINDLDARLKKLEAAK